MKHTMRTEGERAVTLEATIVEFISTQIQGKNDAPVDPDENLFSSGVVDSVGIMRLIAHLESTLEIKIPPRDLVPQNFRTVRVMAEYLDGVSGDAEGALA